MIDPEKKTNVHLIVKSVKHNFHINPKPKKEKKEDK